MLHKLSRQPLISRLLSRVLLPGLPLLVTQGLVSKGLPRRPMGAFHTQQSTTYGQRHRPRQPPACCQGPMLQVTCAGVGGSCSSCLISLD